jgi:hypothetical protein
MVYTALPVPVCLAFNDAADFGHVVFIASLSGNAETVL